VLIEQTNAMREREVQVLSGRYQDMTDGVPLIVQRIR
jgi:hypothetical protein